MKKAALILILISVSANTYFTQEQREALKGDYLGQKPPGLTKQMFLPGMISSDAPEGCLCISFDGNFLVFRRHWREDTTVFLMERKNHEWTGPEIAPFFNQKFRFGDFTFSPNELKLYFTSDRPLKGGVEKNISSDLWVVENINGQWQEPIHLPSPINSTLHESYPSVDKDKMLYFFRRYDAENGLSQIMSAEFKNGRYSEPTVLGRNINTKWDEWDPAVSADGKTLLFCSKKPSGMGEDDIYVSFKDENGRWGAAINLGEKVNTQRSENRPFITADGKYLFFNSDTGGSRNIFWIDMEVIRRLNPYK